MSKSVGNVVEPVKLIDGDDSDKKRFPPMGIDGLRLWVAVKGSDHPVIRLGPNAIAKVETALRDFRKVLKFILGVLTDFDPKKDSIGYDNLQHVDRYVLHMLAMYLARVEAAYENYDFSEAILSALEFLNDSVANLYVTVSKHRLYCASRSSLERRAAQTVLHLVGDQFIRTIAPIMPHLAEEYWLHEKPERRGSLDECLLKSHWPKPVAQWRDDAVARDFETVLVARRLFLAHHGASKYQQYDLKISVPPTMAESFQRLSISSNSHDDETELKDLMLTAQVQVAVEDVPEVTISVSKTRNSLCPRCRRFACCDSNEKLCKFCQSVMSEPK